MAMARNRGRPPALHASVVENRTRRMSPGFEADCLTPALQADVWVAGWIGVIPVVNQLGVPKNHVHVPAPALDRGPRGRAAGTLEDGAGVDLACRDAERDRTRLSRAAPRCFCPSTTRAQARGARRRGRTRALVGGGPAPEAGDALAGRVAHGRQARETGRGGARVKGGVGAVEAVVRGGVAKVQTAPAHAFGVEPGVWADDGVRAVLGAETGVEAQRAALARVVLRPGLDALAVLKTDRQCYGSPSREAHGLKPVAKRARVRCEWGLAPAKLGARAPAPHARVLKHRAGVPGSGRDVHCLQARGKQRKR
eukprot:1383726-Rhodomonas_salina.1